MPHINILTLYTNTFGALTYIALKPHLGCQQLVDICRADKDTGVKYQSKK